MTLPDGLRESAHRAAQEGQEAIHHAEGILKATGLRELGTAVSASADESLKATEAAFDSARIHTEALGDPLAQSRLGGELAREAAHKAEEGRDITSDLERTMAEIGRGKEGRAASEASVKIQRAADHAADAAVGHDADRREEANDQE